MDVLVGAQHIRCLGPSTIDGRHDDGPNGQAEQVGHHTPVDRQTDKRKNDHCSAKPLQQQRAIHLVRYNAKQVERGAKGEMKQAVLLSQKDDPLMVCSKQLYTMVAGSGEGLWLRFVEKG